MLQIDEDKRISIPELIAHEYLNGGKDNEVVSEDSLVQSFASNQSYMSKNKVITKTTVVPESNQSPQKNKNLEAVFRDVTGR